VVDQDAAHLQAGDGEKMIPILNGDRSSANQFQVGLVNQRRGLQGVFLALPAHFTGGNPVELFVDKLGHLLSGLPIAGLHAMQEGGHTFGSGFPRADGIKGQS
jgi:hypothetical protein